MLKMPGNGLIPAFGEFFNDKGLALFMLITAVL